MSKKQIIRPTDSELEILQILWTRGPSSVREINDELNLKREVGYTTTLKIMQIMHEKGILNRNTDNRSHLYESNIKETNTKSNLLNNFLRSTFNGSVKDLVLHALGEGKSSTEELDEIRQMIESIKNKNQK